MFLLDTDVLSALRRRDRNPKVVNWVEAQLTSDMYISVVTVGEIERGISQQRQRNPTFAEELAAWLGRVLSWYNDRVLPVDVAIARRWGRLSANLGHSGPDLFHRGHCVGKWPDRRYPQRPSLRAHRRTDVESFRVK